MTETQGPKTDPPPAPFQGATQNMSEHMKSAIERATKINETLDPDDYRFRYVVSIIAEDHSIFSFHNAFSLNYKDEWLFVFTKHFGYYVFHAQDLFDFKQYEYCGAIGFLDD